MFHLIFTSAPRLVLEFLQLIEAKFFSKSVFPINNPNPKPALDFSAGSFVLKYGSHAPASPKLTPSQPARGRRAAGRRAVGVGADQGGLKVPCVDVFKKV